MDMMLYSWLNGDGNKVDWWTYNFETDPRFDSLAFAWKKPHAENVEKVLEEGDPTGKTDVGAHRLDYLLLKELDEHGIPESASDTVGDWLEHWREVLEDVASDLAEQIKATINDVGEYIREWVNTAGEYVKERWDAAGNYLIERRNAAGQYVTEKWNAAGDYLLERGDAAGKFLIEQWSSGGGLLSRGWRDGTTWVAQEFDNGIRIAERLFYDAAGEQLYRLRRWTGDTLTNFEEFTTAGAKIVDQWLSTSGQWISQQLDGLGHVLNQWTYFGGYGSTLYQWRSWTASGVITGFEEFTSAGAKIVDQWLSTSGQWISQQLDGLGHVLNQWTYFGGYGSQLYQWRSWTAGGVITGFEEFTSAGAKIVDQWLNTSGQWISQQLDGLGHVLNLWTYFGGYGSQLYQWRSWTAGGVITGFEEFTSAGAKIVDQWLNSSGQWISQQLDGLGHVLNQWHYYGGYGSQLYEWAAWTASGTLTNVNRYTTSNLRTLQAYISTTGNWVERHYSNGVEYALRVWNSAGEYLGDQYKNWSDAASRLDPTTAGWWPF